MTNIKKLECAIECCETAAVSQEGDGRFWVIFRNGKVYRAIYQEERFLGDSTYDALRAYAKKDLAKYGKVYALWAKDGRVTIPWKEQTAKNKILISTFKKLLQAAKMRGAGTFFAE